MNLSYNSIGIQGGRIIENNLQHFKNLQSLNLRLNNIGDEGASRHPDRASWGARWCWVGGRGSG